MGKNTELARNLRKNSTPQERILWKLLRNSNIHNCKFKRQKLLTFTFTIVHLVLQIYIFM